MDKLWLTVIDNKDELLPPCINVASNEDKNNAEIHSIHNLYTRKSVILKPNLPDSRIIEKKYWQEMK